MQILFHMNAVICTRVYSILEPIKQLFFVTVRWRKQRCRQAEQGLWHRDGWIQRERQSAYEQREEGVCENATREGKAKEKTDWRVERGEGEWQTCFIPIHHVVFKWVRVVTYEGRTQINHTQKLGLGTHLSQADICRFWHLKKFIFI